jgi:Cu(I)/Ag(I) efflux system membrane protein CusA/SilA
MIARVMAWSARHPKSVLLGSLVLALQCELARRALSPEVLPELADPQLAVAVQWMGHPADAVARDVTNRLGKALVSVPGATAIRGASMPNMAYIDIVFDSSASLSAGRQRVDERVQRAREDLPKDARIKVGPVTSSIGWVFEYAIVDPTHGQPALSLRRLHESLIRPALARVPGVAEVASVGGARSEVVIDAKPGELRAHDVAFSELAGALRALLASKASVNFAELEAAAITSKGQGSEPVGLSQLVRVHGDHEMLDGLAELGGDTTVVGGIIVAKRDVPLRAVVEGVRRVLAGLTPRLPRGVKVVTTYDRLPLALGVERTLLRALLEEIGVVVLVIVAFLLHGRSALVPMATLPLVLLLTCAAMFAFGLPATVMSLGGIGIALGMAVDAEIVALDACHRRLETLGDEASPRERREQLIAAAATFAPAILTSLAITALSFLPVFAFAGETGRLLGPLALSKTLVVASAALVTLTVGPALRDRLLSGRVTAEFDNPLTRVLVRVYRPFVHFALSRPGLTLATAALAVLSCVPIAMHLGGEFLPRIDEGDLLFMPTTLLGVPAEKAHIELLEQNRALREFAEVDTVFGKLGRADTATDPAPLSMAETTLRLKPRSAWPVRAHARWYSSWAPRMLVPLLARAWPEREPYSTAELVEHLDRAVQRVGWVNAWTAPARGRMDMLATGVRTPVGARIIAKSPERLEQLGAALRSLAASVPGARSAVCETLGGDTWLEFVPDPEALARYGVEPALARDSADLLIADGRIGEVMRDGERLRVRVTPEISLRSPADRLRGATVRGSAGPTPLGLLGRVGYVRHPASLRSEDGEIASYVYVDLVAGTDPEQYVEAATRALERARAANTLRLLPGERIEWTGQYRLLAEGQRRLRFIIPLVVVSMFALLWLQFRSLGASLIILASVPFALVGSLWTLFLAGYPLSAPVWVGLLSVVGVAMQTGVVMIVYIDEAFHRRLREGRVTSRADIVEAHAEGTIRRLRPKVMTVTTMAAALLPLLWETGPGAEVMRRVAAPMLGGLLASAFLTLEVLPVLYTLWRNRQMRRARALGVPLETLVGTAPRWMR